MKKAKRETNAQRRKREGQCRAILQIAKQIMGNIRTRRNASLLSDQERGLFEYADKVFHSTFDDDTWVENESIENITNGLRLAADMLEGKPMDGRSLSGYDRRIEEAFLEASCRARRQRPGDVKALYEDEISRIVTLPKPTFSEILEVYRERNPGVKAQDRTLRRSLQRLGFIMSSSDKRGRQKEK